MGKVEPVSTFVVLEERKSTTGHDSWNGQVPDTRQEHVRLREVFDERFPTATAAQAAGMGMLEDPNRAKSKPRVLFIAELCSKIVSKVDVSTSIEPIRGVFHDKKI